MRLVKSLEDRSSRLVGRPRKVKNSLVSILLNERHGRAGQAFVVSQFRLAVRIETIKNLQNNHKLTRNCF